MSRFAGQAANRVGLPAPTGLMVTFTTASPTPLWRTRIWICWGARAEAGPQILVCGHAEKISGSASGLSRLVGSSLYAPGKTIVPVPGSKPERSAGPPPVLGTISSGVLVVRLKL